MYYIDQIVVNMSFLLPSRALSKGLLRDPKRSPTESIGFIDKIQDFVHKFVEIKEFMSQNSVGRNQSHFSWTSLHIADRPPISIFCRSVSKFSFHPSKDLFKDCINWMERT